MMNAASRKIEHLVLNWMMRREQQRHNAGTRLRILAWIGCIGMPLYYVIWTLWLPQEFESLGLRLVGMVLCLPAICAPHYFKGGYLAAYQFIGVTYILPFFFTFMFLMNHGSALWSQSLLIALIVLFHFDLLWALASLAVGATLAGLIFARVGDPHFLLSPGVLGQLPIYGFAIVVVSIAKVGRRVLAREKLAGMAQALATVSHELRTPLISVGANVRGVERCLTAQPPFDAPDRRAIGEAMARVQFEVRHMNHMIDLFLQSATALNQNLEPSEHVSMRSVVASVMERYPFTTQAQRDQVCVVIRNDFTFAGKYDLCVVLLLNLLRNALKALQRAGKGQVRIIVDGARNTPQLLVMDSGCGIPAKQLPFIFERFYSYPPSSGAGIGLALCKEIIEAWHANIRCRSRERAYTVFALRFPEPATVQPEGISY
jgi:two-component system CAI-1 autoinducer sensor kinase/phosphatase CqsS